MDQDDGIQKDTPIEEKRWKLEDDAQYIILDPEQLKKTARIGSQLSVVALNRLFSCSINQCNTFFKVIKQAQKDKWCNEYEKAFQHLKKYLTLPPLLSKLEVVKE